MLFLSWRYTGNGLFFLTLYRKNNEFSKRVTVFCSRYASFSLRKDKSRVPYPKVTKSNGPLLAITQRLPLHNGCCYSRPPIESLDPTP